MRPGVSARFRVTSLVRLRLGLRRGSASGSSSGSPKSSRGSHSSHLGRYQFQSPSSFIVAGSSTRADDRRVDQDRRREPDAELLEEQHRERAEDREHADHDDRCARDDAGGGLDPVRDRLVRARAAVERLADPADDEHVVVHREAEQDHEQEQRHHRLDPAAELTPSRPLPTPCWKTSTSTP